MYVKTEQMPEKKKKDFGQYWRDDYWYLHKISDQWDFLLIRDLKKKKVGKDKH